MTLFAASFAALALAASVDRSATWDEPIHLTAGYAALTNGDFRVDPSHPPLLRIWAALPARAVGPAGIDTQTIDQTVPRAWLQDAYGYAHRFMYVENDADRMLRRARIMIVALGVLLGILVFRWAREWLGLVPAAAALVLFTLEPNLLAHASLVTTDLGLTTFVFATVYFLWRTGEHPTRLNAAAAACCAGLAAASKFSAVLLAPIVILLLAVMVWRRTMTPRVAVALCALMATTAIAAIWITYGLRFLPSGSAGWTFDFSDSEFAGSQPTLAALAAWVDGHRLLPNAYTQGFLYTQVSSQAMPSFLAGERSVDGWWYYFPIAFLIKTPIALILLLAAGLFACAARSRVPGRMPLAFVGVPIVVFLGAAMASGINLGLRHILPIYPFVLLIAAAGVKSLLATRARWVPVALGVVLLGGMAEFARAYPYPLAFFNHLVGGPANGHRYLADSNLGWGGNLKRLKTWMEREGVAHVNLAYFGQADPHYYGIDATHLPGAPGFATEAVARPRLPGYVAISPTIMHGVYAPPEWRLFYEPFRDREPHAVIGNSLRVYWVDEWPGPAGPAGEARDAEAHGILADALLLGLQWPEGAVPHYREHLRRQPDDVNALTHFGIALVLSDRTAEGLEVLRAAVDAGPDDGPARLTLARALFGTRDLPGASAHAEQAARLMPHDPDAYDFLGRVRAAEGRFDDALQAFQRALQIDPAHPAAREHAARLTGTP